MCRRQSSSEFSEETAVNCALLKFTGIIRWKGSTVVGENILIFVSFACLFLYAASYAYEVMENPSCLECIAMAMSAIGASSRFSILILSRDKCQRMLDTCELLWSALATNEQKDMVRYYVRTTRRLTYLYLSSCCSTIFSYAVVTLLVPLGVSDQGAGNETLQLANISRPLPYACPVEIRESPWYEVTFALQIFVVTHVAFLIVGVDMLGPLFAFVACGHFESIRSRLEGLSSIAEQPTGSRGGWPEMASETQLEEFRGCVTHHRTLLEFCEDIDQLTHVMLMIQLMSSTYNISLVGFKLVGTDPDKGKYLAQLAIVVTQLLLSNWPADILASKSQDVSLAAYSAPWYQYPRWLRGPTALLIMRAQRPARITAGKIVVLSLETFANLVSSAASFFTLVNSMN